MSEHLQGFVKFYKPDAGYGFIEPEGGGKDAFVHVSEIEKAFGRGAYLDPGDRIEYEMVPGRNGRQCAGNLRRPEGQTGLVS